MQKKVKEMTVVRLHDPLIFIETARQGIARAAIDLVGKRLSLTDREMARILNMSERTLHRYLPDNQLDTPTTERLLKLILLYHHGEEIFADLEVFKPWMRTPLEVLGYKMPLELLDTATGFKLVDDVLTRIEFGVYS